MSVKGAKVGAVGKGAKVRVGCRQSCKSWGAAKGAKVGEGGHNELRETWGRLVQAKVGKGALSFDLGMGGSLCIRKV